ncbi:MAG: hypothetical protein U5K79_25765 [Cyclobacteriaceae bacterium]|nr:hypothetical protein [Cyclobacteriaceae bacterium]
MVKELAEKLNYKNGLYKYFEHSAIVSLTKGDYTFSMQQIRSALDQAKEIGAFQAL